MAGGGLRLSLPALMAVAAITYTFAGAEVLLDGSEPRFTSPSHWDGGLALRCPPERGGRYEVALFHRGPCPACLDHAGACHEKLLVSCPEDGFLELGTVDLRLEGSPICGNDEPVALVARRLAASVPGSFLVFPTQCWSVVAVITTAVVIWTALLLAWARCQGAFRQGS